MTRLICGKCWEMLRQRLNHQSTFLWLKICKKQKEIVENVAGIHVQRIFLTPAQIALCQTRGQILGVEFYFHFCML
ncbi:CLUMA_CG019310, isoform A [Clunio marinus]|uniref:CLUMA_CG019310, isoform A n=1 Tax=Clunio marinus TaxID=568069 RepID=A0A1J1J0Y8_9DIPT|nr:CLUMA_CG019310, isoform A [Clunio marinus]